MNRSSETLGIGVAYQGTVPLRCRAPAQEVTDAYWAGLQADNEEVLRTYQALEEFRQDPEDGAASQDIQRLDLKLNILLDLVGQIFARYTAMPDATDVRLSSAVVEWLSTEAISPGTVVELELYLNSRYPRPLLFIAQVTYCAGEGADHRVAASLRPMGELAQEALEKFIFRHHRRQVAYARKGYRFGPVDSDEPQNA